MLKKWQFAALLAFLGVAGNQALADGSSCGLEGTVEQRLADCGQVFPDLCMGNDAVWAMSTRTCSTATFRKKGVDSSWRLVSRSPEAEVWRDESTGLVWSERFERALTQSGASKICEFSENGNVKMTVGLRLPFRLPTEGDYRKAVGHGLHVVLRGMAKRQYWTSTGINLAAFAERGAAYRAIAASSPKELQLFRCVAAANVAPVMSIGGYKTPGYGSGDSSAGGESGARGAGQTTTE